MDPAPFETLADEFVPGELGRDDDRGGLATRDREPARVEPKAMRRKRLGVAEERHIVDADDERRTGGREREARRVTNVDVQVDAWSSEAAPQLVLPPNGGQAENEMQFDCWGETRLKPDTIVT
jgi:hypothetical protein